MYKKEKTQKFLKATIKVFICLVQDDAKTLYLHLFALKRPNKQNIVSLSEYLSPNKKTFFLFQIKQQVVCANVNFSHLRMSCHVELLYIIFQKRSKKLFYSPNTMLNVLFFFSGKYKVKEMFFHKKKEI